jgi:DNA-3-methyladenine glycosylase II
MVRTAATITESVNALAALEPAFAAVVEQHGIPEPRVSEPGATTLLRTIVGQQVSVAAARSMWAKLEAAYGAPPDLARILKASDEELRLAGISRQKAG